jgi:hypothetical protein
MHQYAKRRSWKVIKPSRMWVLAPATDRSAKKADFGKAQAEVNLYIKDSLLSH